MSQKYNLTQIEEQSRVPILVSRYSCLDTLSNSYK